MQSETFTPIPSIEIKVTQLNYGKLKVSHDGPWLKEWEWENNEYININDKCIEQSLKLLGVDVDDQLDFRCHISEICKRISRRVGVLMRLRNLAPLYIQNLFCTNDKTRTYNLRNSDFRILRFNVVKYGKHSIRHLGPFLWSKLM